MKRVLTWTSLTWVNLNEAENKLQFQNSAGQYFNGNIGNEKSVSGSNSILSFSLSYDPTNSKWMGH